MKMKHVLVLLLLIIINCDLCSELTSDITTNDSHVPVIGIVTQPLNYEGHTINTNPTQMIDVKYAMNLMASGAKVVPVLYTTPEAELRNLMGKLNGLFFPGGSTLFAVYNPDRKEYVWTPFANAAKVMLQVAKELNNRGIYFPVWGTCMGFQLLVFLVSEDPTIPKPGCDCANYTAELQFTQEGITSRLFAGFSTKQMDDFRLRALIFFNNHYYVNETDFQKHPSLRDFFKVLSYSWDKTKTLKFVTAIEARQYPFYGTQFHPELNVYSNQNRISGPESTRLAQAFGNFFLNETRKSPNRLSDEEDIALSLYRTPIVRDPRDRFNYLFP